MALTLPRIAVCLWFDQRDEPSRLVSRLRGGQVFQAMKDYPRLVPLADAQIHLPGLSGGLSMPSREGKGTVIVFADLPILVDNPGLYDQLLAVSGLVLVVDLHFPLPSPNHVLAVQPGRSQSDRDEALDEGVRQQWRDPDRVEQARRILGNADLVTISREDWMPPREANWVRAVLLPDVEDGDLDTAAEFYQRWWNAVGRVLCIRTGLARWFALAMFRHQLRRLRRQVPFAVHSALSRSEAA